MPIISQFRLNSWMACAEQGNCVFITIGAIKMLSLLNF
jgi:hypothetical protein